MTATYTLRRGETSFLEGGGCVESVSCEWAGQRFEARSRSSAIMELARRLVAAGAPDAPWQSVTVDGEPSTYGPSLHRLAWLTIKEGVREGIKLGRYQERPDFTTGDGQGGVPDIPPCWRKAQRPDRPGNEDFGLITGLSRTALAEA
jgi:hypothetical protein